MTIAESWRKEGRKQGFEKGMKRGMEQGLEQGLEQAARQMLRENFPLTTVVKITGLSIDLIEKIKISQGVEVWA